MSGMRMALLLLRTPRISGVSEVISPVSTLRVSISVMMPRDPVT